MKPCVVIGGGILGRSAAWAAVRRGCSVTLWDSGRHPAGSPAAAALLSTKGQLEARCPHFAWKIEARRTYRTWIQGWAQASQNPLLSDAQGLRLADTHKWLYREGLGCDLFEESEKAEQHLKRIQEKETVWKRCGLSSAPQRPIDPHRICPGPEAWVDAAALLPLLEKALRLSGVEFVQKDFAPNFVSELPPQAKILVCAGAWTAPLLERLGWGIPPGMRRRERLTGGSTLTLAPKFPLARPPIPPSESIVDLTAKGHPKISLTWQNEVLHLGTTTLHFDRGAAWTPPAENPAFAEGEKALRHSFAASYPLLGCETPLPHWLDEAPPRRGLRVGYGHSELVAEPLLDSPAPHSAFVCTGAHKSGYLFAAVMDDILQAAGFWN